MGTLPVVDHHIRARTLETNLFFKSRYCFQNQMLCWEYGDLYLNRVNSQQSPFPRCAHRRARSLWRSQYVNAPSTVTSLQIQIDKAPDTVWYWCSEWGLLLAAVLAPEYQREKQLPA